MNELNGFHALITGGPSGFGFDMDVRSEESVDASAGWIRANWMRLDMLVNNAGIGMGAANRGFPTAPIPFFQIRVKDFYDIVEMNFIGYFLVARAFAPIMIQNGGGRIVNVSTGIKTMTARGQLPYGPARAGAEAMSVIMTEELKDYNITVNVLLPGGPSDTGFVTDDVRGHFESMGLLPASVMNEAISFLASAKATGVTGERIIAKDFQQWLVSHQAKT